MQCSVSLSTTQLISWYSHIIEDNLRQVTIIHLFSSFQNLDSELKGRFPNVNFWPSSQNVQLQDSVDGVELVIPSTIAGQQGYSVVSSRNCQVSLISQWH